MTQNWFFHRQRLNERMREHFNKLQWIHVHARAAHSHRNKKHSYSLQVNFNPFYGPRTPSKKRIAMKISWTCSTTKSTHLVCLCHCQPRPKKKSTVCVCFCTKHQKHVVSRHVSLLFLKFSWTMGCRGRLYHHAKFTCEWVQCFRERVIICFVRARHDFHVFNALFGGKFIYCVHSTYIISSSHSLSLYLSLDAFAHSELPAVNSKLFDATRNGTQVV